MSGRLLAAALLLALTSGCASHVAPLTLRDVAKGANVEAYADSKALAEAEGEGKLRRGANTKVKAGGRPVSVVTSHLTDGEIREISVVCERGQADQREYLTPLATLAVPRDGAADAGAFLSSAGLERRALVGFLPREKAALYETDKTDVFVGIGPGSPPRLALVFKGETALLLDLGGVFRWKAVENRLKAAVAANAGLEQVRDEVACVELIPYQEDRAAAEPLVKTFQGALDQRAAEISAAWTNASLVDRCALAREVHDVVLASGKKPDERFASLEKRLRDELGDQLDAEVKKATAAGATHTAAGWLVARARSMGDERALGEARKLLGASVSSLVPALSGTDDSLVEPLYGGDELLGARSPLVLLAGVRTGSRSQFLEAASGTAARLELGPVTDDVKESLAHEKWLHKYTYTNPQWIVWNDRLKGLEGELAAAEAMAKANSNYEKREQVNFNIYVTTTNLTMKAAYEAWMKVAGNLVAQIADHKTAQPRRRLPTQTTYDVETQAWSGTVTCHGPLHVDGAKHDIVLSYPVGANGARTKGSNASDDPAENIPASNTFTTKAVHLAEARKVLAKSLASTVGPHLRTAIRARLAAHLERVPDARLRGEEQDWAHYFFDLEQKNDARARFARALGGS